MQDRKRKTNLFMENALLNSNLDEDRQKKLLTAKDSALRNYLKYIESSIKVVQEQGSFLLNLKPKKVEVTNLKNEIVTELRHYFDLTILKEKLANTIEKEIFDSGVSSVYTKQPTGNYKIDREHQIRISYSNKDESYLILETDEELDKIYFRANDYQLKMQEKAIKSLMREPLPHLEPIIRLFDDFNYGKNKPEQYFINSIQSVSEISWKILQDGYDGTDQQRAFVKKALATKDFALLEGPPGSGKTTAIIELILQLIERGQRVLLVSATHVAVDNVIHRILTSYKDKCESKVVPIRIATNKGAIRKETVEPYRLEDFVKTTKKSIKVNIRNRQDNKARKTLYKSLNSKQEFMDNIILNSANLVGGTMMGILQHPSIKDGTNDLFDVMIVDESSKVTFLDFIVPARFAKKWILVGDVQQLSPYVENDYISESIDSLIEDEETKRKLITAFELKKQFKNTQKKQDLKIIFSDILTQEDFKGFGQVAILNESFQATENNILRINGADILICANNKKCKDLVAKHIFVKATFFEGEMNNIQFRNRQKFLHRTKGKQKFPFYSFERSPVDKRQKWGDEVASKISQVYEYRMNKNSSRKQKLDTEIELLVLENLKPDVDNIRKIALPSILELLQVGVGESIITKRNGESYSQESVLYLGFNRFPLVKDRKFQTLSYQHRMNDAIAQTSREHFYKGEKENLITANTVTERPNPLKNYKPNEADVIWMHNNDNTFKKKGKNINPTECNHIEQELKELLRFAKGNPKIEKGENVDYEIAILTFYKNQEFELRKMLRKFCNQSNQFKNFSINNLKITLCTVDKFQGDEADIVLLSFVKFTKGAFYNSPNRLNVGLTRAKFKLVLFGNKAWFEKSAPSEALQYLAENFKSRLTS